MNSKDLMKLGNETLNETDPSCLHSAELEKLGNEQSETECWMCSAYGNMIHKIDTLDVCQECLVKILTASTCRVCGTSIPEDQAMEAYHDAGFTEGVRLECLVCNIQNDSIPYWTNR